MNVVYVTGNSHKAKYFSKMVGIDVDNIKLELEELQSNSLSFVVEHKVKAAYAQLKCPVIVEDTKLSFNALGSLPGPFIKWFLDELKPEGLIKLLAGYADKTAIAGAAIAYFNGENLEIFEKELHGTISDAPKGDSGFGWNIIFTPDGATETLGEMKEEEFEHYYKKVKPFQEVASFLKNLDNR